MKRSKSDLEYPFLFDLLYTTIQLEDQIWLVVQN